MNWNDRDKRGSTRPSDRKPTIGDAYWWRGVTIGRRFKVTGGSITFTISGIGQNVVRFLAPHDQPKFPRRVNMGVFAGNFRTGHYRWTDIG